MSISFKRKQIICLFIWSIMSIMEVVYINQLNYSRKTLLVILGVVVFNFFMQIIILKINSQPVLSFFSAFILLLNLFHFGQLFGVAFNFDSELAIIFNDYMDDKVAVIRTLSICITSINTLFIGGLCTIGMEENRELELTADNIIQSQLFCRRFGWILFAISLPFRLYIDLSHINVGFSEGYLAAYSSVVVSGITGCIASFWFISLPLIYITIKNRKSRRLFLVIVSTYMVISMMLSGSRANQVVGFMGLFLIIYIYSEKKINFMNIIKISIVIFLAAFVISIIAKTRTYGGAYLINNFLQVCKEALEDNFLVEAIMEMGGTIWTPYLVEVGQESLTPFPGETYIKSLITIVPNIFRAPWYSEIQREAVIGYVLIDKLYIKGIGGSFIAEMYYNFYGLYWIGTFAFGIIYNSFSSKVNIAIYKGDYKKVCKYLPLLIFCVFWIRDSFCGLLRSVVWISILFWIMNRTNLGNVFRKG
ncbi:O-antigen polysaccharide polymerase Wzy [Clostridium sp.]|uniref:O-antigen polysaccharide polymerase Wzy n=1 Tax=Clostridium sp. TaxID=1506 RepID=UPI002912C331|nr:O-antigen polysaccharide polymerase Wzy [Clostridium sp.]MDU3411320.1 O-antigen polysaccharide polymerase Wzy [Clostridium sp.]